MAERFTLTTPIVTTQQVTDFAVEEIHLYRAQQLIVVIFTDSLGNRVVWRKENSLALILALNKANLSVKSLERQCIERAAADGVFGVGAVSGAPD